MAFLALETQNVVGLSLTPRETLTCADFPLRTCPLHCDYVIIVMYENGRDSLGVKPLVNRNFLVMVC